ncbi:hypothetical protein VIN01S_14080 [Vibrio inusitatus NBRC 102082]|uniref:DNA polymerase III subunit beta n=1 Tax=Vibrio inusitatus NBRC 102082 TaxID=1219070 RepID=A0A4Y3HWF8_9VIBR|nr:hypothetical protein [Vibrio inusitatus]GEA50604.1 hypothetical protein VIN01S_14080 [Vibrio inusitatus NBRC 102082]
MRVKVLGTVLLGSALLFGCASTGEQVPWMEAASTVQVEQTSVTLESTMWGNKMPTFDEVHSIPLHGSLILSSSDAIPADLGVTSIWIRHNGEAFQIDANAFDLEAVTEKQWKISFKQMEHYDGNFESADVAVELESDVQKIWLVEKSVDVDTVY